MLNLAQPHGEFYQGLIIAVFSFERGKRDYPLMCSRFEGPSILTWSLETSNKWNTTHSHCWEKDHQHQVTTGMAESWSQTKETIPA